MKRNEMTRKEYKELAIQVNGQVSKVFLFRIYSDSEFQKKTNNPLQNFKKKLF